MHAFRSYIFAARIACDSGPTCYSQEATRLFPVYTAEKREFRLKVLKMHLPLLRCYAQ